MLPGTGYGCSTHNHSFHTTGDEELLRPDDPEGTRIQYTYLVSVNRFFAPLFARLVRSLVLPFWKRSYVDRLNVLLKSE